VATALPHRSASSELRSLLTLAWPIVVAQVGMSLMGFVDTVLVGPLGAEALSALALGNTLYFGLLILGKGTLMSLDAHVSQAYGAGDLTECRRGLIQGMWMVAAIAPLLVFGMTWIPDLLTALGYDPAMSELARLYLGPLRWGVPISLLFTVHRSFLSAVDVTRPLLISAVVANVANVVLDLWFIRGGYGISPLGVEGVAWATSACRFALLAPVAWVAWFRADFKRFVVPSWAADPVLIRRLLGIGIPVGLQYFAEVSAFSGAAIMMGILGPTPLAAHQICLNAVAVAFMIPLGIGSASAVRTGQAIGARDGRGLHLAAWTGIGVAFVYSLGTATIFAVFPDVIAGFYGVDGAVFTLALEFFAVAALFQVGDSIQAVAVGVLRGLADTRAAFVLALVGYVGLATPIAIVGAFVLDDDPVWIWWGLLIGLSVAAALMCARIYVQVRKQAAAFS
jgi:multidrug resistance protein, MATE family